MIIHVYGDEATTPSPRAVERDSRALGWLVRGIWGTGYFFLSLPVVGGDMGRKRRIRSINTRLCGWCHHHSFGLLGVFFDNRVAYMAAGLPASDGIRLYQRGKRVFAQELVGLVGFKLDMKGKWANINFNNLIITLRKQNPSCTRS